jgi:hypothetical protein
MLGCVCPHQNKNHIRKKINNTGWVPGNKQNHWITGTHFPKKSAVPGTPVLTQVVVPHGWQSNFHSHNKKTMNTNKNTNKNQ